MILLHWVLLLIVLGYRKVLVISRCKALGYFIILVIKIITGTRRELTASLEKFFEFTTRGQEESKIGCRWFHRTGKVLWMILNTNEIGMVCISNKQTPALQQEDIAYRQTINVEVINSTQHVQWNH